MTHSNLPNKPVTLSQLVLVAVLVAACHVSLVCYAAWRRGQNKIDPTSPQFTQQLSHEALRTQP